MAIREVSGDIFEDMEITEPASTMTHEQTIGGVKILHRGLLAGAIDNPNGGDGAGRWADHGGRALRRRRRLAVRHRGEAANEWAAPSLCGFGGTAERLLPSDHHIKISNCPF